MPRNADYTGLQIALNVGAMLLAFVALIAVVNGILGGIGGWRSLNKRQTHSAQVSVRYSFPLRALHAKERRLQMRSVNTIISFALCGFANFSSIAIMLGTLGGLAPSRRSDMVCECSRNNRS
jgi:CNT family concentrative nucleoside transporter